MESCVRAFFGMTLRIGGRRGRGRCDENAEIMETLRNIHAKMEAIRATIPWDHEVGDVKELERETSTKEKQQEDIDVKLLKTVMGVSSTSK